MAAKTEEQKEFLSVFFIKAKCKFAGFAFLDFFICGYLVLTGNTRTSRMAQDKLEKRKEPSA